MQAALKGASRSVSPIISLTISLVAVLIPLLFMGMWWAVCSTNSRSP